MITDPDYARCLTMARCIAWSYGWCIVQHGTGTRDLDLLMVPWEETAAPAEGVVHRIADVTKTKVDRDPGKKPHGRLAWTLHFPDFGDPRWIDLSVMPRIEKPKTLICTMCGIDRLKEGCSTSPCLMTIKAESP